MQTRVFSFLMLLIGVAIFSSCSKTNKQGQHIPKNAAIVVQFNGKALNEKLPWSEVKNNELFKKMAEDSSLKDYERGLMADPATSGVKPDADMRIFLVKDSSGMFTAIEGSIGDEAKFKAFLAQTLKTGKESKKDDHTYWTDEKGTIAYSKDHFLAVVNTPDFTKRPAYEAPEFDSAGNIITKPAMEMPANRDMIPVASGLLNLKESESLSKDERFTKLMKEDADVSFWYSAEHMMDQSMMGMLGMFGGVGKMLNGNVAAMTFNFNDGKIEGKGWQYMGKEMTDLAKKYEAGSVDKDMIKNIPIQNLAGYYAMNFKPEALKAMMQLMGVDGMANMGMSKFGITVDDFVKANKGDVIIAVGDLSVDSFGGTKPSVFFGASIADKNSFNKLINAGKSMMGGGMDADSTAKAGYAVNDKYFGIADQKATVDAWLTGAKKTTSRAVANIPSSPASAYIDLKYILNFASQTKNLDSTAAEMLRVSRDFWDNVTMSGGEIKDGAMTSTFDINLVDTKVNSLKQLNTYISKMGAMAMEKQKRDRTRYMDTEVVPVTPDTAVIAAP